jgi:outer membrane biosynthesis protein TonB
MRVGAFLSVVFHVALIVVAYYGIPSLRRDVMMETPIMVEIVNVAEITNAPQPEVKPEKQAKVEEPKPEPPKPEPKPEPPKPEVKVAPPPPPEPEPEPEPAPEPEVAIVPPPPEAKPKAKEKPKPKPEPKPEVKKKPEPKPKPKPKAPAALVKVKPKKKPKPPDAFASVLKTVADLKRQPVPAQKEPEEKKKKEEPKASFEDQIAKALVSKKRSFDQSKPLSISEIDYVRQQIAKCWNPPAGAKNAQDMIIEIAVAMNMDGTVRDARINNKNIQSDPFLQAMAESALRATLNRHCQPFKLPRDKFDRWKTMTLVFNPKEMLGG